MHQSSITKRKVRQHQQRRSRFAKRLLAFAAPFLFGPIAVNVGPSKAGGTPHIEQITKVQMRGADFEVSLRTLYAQIAPETVGLRYEVFREAMVGYLNLRRTGEIDVTRKLLTIVDFEQSSTQKRLYVLDLENKKILFNTLVAHGRGSGDDLANRFSNEPESFMSSLGFFVTGEPYHGKHGLSMHLNGKDEGYNNNAFDRAVVMHAADYVSEEFVKVHGRLGRSHGCPALPPALNGPIIEQIQSGTCLFLYSPKERLESKFLDSQLAMESFFADGRQI